MKCLPKLPLTQFVTKFNYFIHSSLNIQFILFLLIILQKSLKSNRKFIINKKKKKNLNYLQICQNFIFIFDRSR